MLFFIRIAIVLIALQILPALFLYFRYLHKKRHMRIWRNILAFTTISLCIGSLWYVVSGFTTGRPEWFCFLFFHLLLGISISEILICLGSILAWCFKKIPFLSRTMLMLGFTSAIVCLITIIMAFFIGNKRIEVIEYSYVSKDIPQAFDGMRIVHISDLHLGTYGTDTTRVAELIEKTMEQKGDIIVFTGDLVNFESKEALPFAQQLKQLSAPYGVFSILGNHDYALYRMFPNKTDQLDDINKLAQTEKECGWTLLRNENTIVEKDGEKIAIIGMENDGKPPFPQLANIPKAMKGLPSNNNGAPLFKIMLTHDPSHWRRNILTQTDAQLTLAGHTHGMQFMLGKWSPASLVYKEWGGQYYDGARSLIVSIGLGLGAVPFRYGAWSEVCVITLHSKK